MAGPNTKAASRSGVSKEGLLEGVLRFVPSAIKLRRPELHSGVVPRPELTTRLADTDATIGLVVAPPGYGKTMLVRQMTAAAGRPYAWLTITAEDNDPSAFLVYLALALDSVEPLDPQTFAALAMSEADLVSIRLPRLGNVLANRAQPFVLVLDDVHLLHEAGSVAVLERLAADMPRGSQLVLAGRSAPPLALPRMNVKGDLLRIGAESLAMNEREGRTLLAEAGVQLGPGALESLVSRIEGWPAGLYLAAITLRDSHDPSAAAARFAGDDRLVADYLRDEALRAFPDELRDFLVRSSVLDRVSARVCDDVLERDDSARMLAAIEASNLFLVPLDRHGEWYRYHHLFRDMLDDELNQLDPSVRAKLHARASEWWERHGDIDGALGHARAAYDIDRMAELIWLHAPAYLSRGRTATVTRWLEPFTPDEVATHAPLALAAAWWSLTAGDTGSVGYWASLAERAEGEILPGGMPVRAAVLLLRALGGTQGLTRARDDAALAFGLDRPDSPFRPIARFIEGSAHRLLGDRELARDCLEDGARLSGVLHPSVYVHCLSDLALLAIDAGAPAEGAALIDQAMREVDRYVLGERPAMALVYATAALSHARQGETAAARSASKHGLWLLEKLTGFGAGLVADAALALARATLLLGDVSTSRMLVREAHRILARCPDAGVLPTRLEEVERMTDASTVPVGLAATPLTPAEMRVLRYLPTHLSFEAIAEELIVSRNTVKTQAIAAYRKLGVSSRAEAVAQARELGLLE
ncbi:MAG TPA: LuxR C-terminal-related transcriptional regulator, partial [Acidimicrobiia bacterium]|nr:LuxR C-terminal-related transcriptional regulator [Acidimicrobiia bacterium]